MGVISVRVSDEVEEYLREHHLVRGTFGREAIEAEVRRRRAKESSEFLASIASKWKTEKTAVELIREDRDSDHGRAR